jgi:glycosyltransferase involved in cell wall biosynthesis
MLRGSFNPVVVAPTYNNARTLPLLVSGVLALDIPLIVVNDGSTDETAAVLESFRDRAGCTVVTHPRNRGKAAALRSGFAAAAVEGFTHAVSVDTDGQHEPPEIPRLIERAREEPAALVIGLRDESKP